MQRIPRLSRESLPLWSTAAVLAVFFIAFWMCPASEPGSAELMTSEFRRQYQLISSYDQRVAFLLSVVATIVLAAAAFIVSQRSLIPSKGRANIPVTNVWLSIFATVIGLTIFSRFIQAWVTIGASALAACFFIFIIVAPYLRRRVIDLCALLFIGAYLSVVVAPGFVIWPISFPVVDANSVAQLEIHLTSLVQPGSAITAGLNFFREIPYGYGLLMPSIVSVIDRIHGPLSVGDDARLVQYCQVAFTVMATLSYFYYRPRNYVGILAALLMAAPYWATTGLGIWHPNQTGFRSLTLPLGILAMAMAGYGRPNNAAWGLGAVCMVALLINVETTIAVGCGMLVYLSLRTRTLPLIAMLRMTIGAVLVFLLYLILYDIALGRLPFGIDLATLLSTFLEHTSGDAGLRLFAGGYWGEGYYLVPLALVMFTHAVYIIIASYQKLADRPLSHRQALRAGIATILLIWFAYYINSPNWWQIWTHLFLYSFLVIDLFDLRLFSVGTAESPMTARQGRHIRTRITHAIPIFLLSMVILHTNSNLAFYMKDFLSPPWTRTDHDAVVLSDIQLPRATAQALEEKSRYLRELNIKNPGKIVYLTYNVEFVPALTRLFEPAPARALWGYISGDAALDPAIDKIIATKPVAILIDTPTGPLAVDGPRKDFQDRVRQSVSRLYHIADTQSGWQIWRPNTL